MMRPMSFVFALLLRTAVFPYKLLFVAKDPTSLCGDAVAPLNLALCPQDATPCAAGFMCQSAFDQVNEALERIKDGGQAHSNVSDLVGVTQLNGPIQFSAYETAITHAARGTTTSYDASIGLLYSSSCESTASESGGANLCASTLVSILLEADPYSLQGVAWLGAARSQLTSLAAQPDYPFELYLGFGAGMTVDVTDAVYDSFPLIVAVTLGTVFVLMGAAFQSLVVPLRSVATLALTVAFVFGLLVLVYQHGAFDFIGARAVGNAHAISWLPPVMCFSIIVGLGLDYDVFLISRVFEYRLLGYTDHAAAVKGICSTGYIITAAGLIMAVAFGGLFTSSELILNQAAFLLVFAVVLDTFVVRTLCVPALLGLTGSKSWWPKELPPATKDIGF